MALSTMEANDFTLEKATAEQQSKLTRSVRRCNVGVKSGSSTAFGTSRFRSPSLSTFCGTFILLGSRWATILTLKAIRLTLRLLYFRPLMPPNTCFVIGLLSRLRLSALQPHNPIQHPHETTNVWLCFHLPGPIFIMLHGDCSLRETMF